MSGDDNKRAVAAFVERCQNQHDLDYADEAFHPQFVTTTGPRGGLSRKRIGPRAQGCAGPMAGSRAHRWLTPGTALAGRARARSASGWFVSELVPPGQKCSGVFRRLVSRVWA
jgi:hypothetical protein